MICTNTSTFQTGGKCEVWKRAIDETDNWVQFTLVSDELEHFPKLTPFNKMTLNKLKELEYPPTTDVSDKWRR